MYRKVTREEREIEKRLIAEEQKLLKRSADIDYIAMMTDVEIPEEDEQEAE